MNRLALSLVYSVSQIPYMVSQKCFGPFLPFDWPILDSRSVPNLFSLASLRGIHDKTCHYNHMHCFAFNFDNKRRQMPTLWHFCLVEIALKEILSYISLLITELSKVVLSFDNNFDTSVKCSTGLCRQITYMCAIQYWQLSFHTNT